MHTIWSRFGVGGGGGGVTHTELSGPICVRVVVEEEEEEEDGMCVDQPSSSKGRFQLPIHM